jgi:hypothetical protein
MRRILIIDDHAPAFAGEIEADVRDDHGNAATLRHINPTDFFVGSATPDQTVSELLSEVTQAAMESWDVIAIDLFLGDFGLQSHGDLEVCLRVAETAYEQNKSATIILYSGTLAKYVDGLLQGGARDTQLRRIFYAGIANFVPRNRVAREVASAVDNPSWLLRIDRMLMHHSTLLVGPEEAEFQGRDFASLAKSVRRQDRDGQRITQLVAEQGVACFVDLNS